MISPRCKKVAKVFCTELLITVKILTSWDVDSCQVHYQGKKQHEIEIK